MFQLRPKQQEVAAFARGRMGVAAVPGSGKTHTLSHLAAQIVGGGRLEDDQEVLVVTLVNSAVDNFAARISGMLDRSTLFPYTGYRVRTLHALAHDIVKECPSLVGLANDFQIVDEREADQIMQDAVAAWLRTHPTVADGFFDREITEGRRDWLRKDGRSWPQVVADVAYGVIRLAKDRQRTPEMLRQALDALDERLPLLEMGWEIYEHYQRALSYRGAVDFEDLIRLALKALETDGAFLTRLRQRWPFILEDEAQDSSSLQEKILRKLAGPAGNWVRVGDPNQAIYETFTTADPEHFRKFLKEDGVVAKELPNSGRSARSIRRLANYLVWWTANEHPVPGVRDALAAPPYILPTPPGDPQPNPEDDPDAVCIVDHDFTPMEEACFVADSLEAWLPAHRDRTVAVLAPRNDRGSAIADLLKHRGIPHVELLKSSGATRAAAGALANIINYLAEPDSPERLAKAYQVWRRADRADTESAARAERVARALRKVRQVEDFLWPRLDRGIGSVLEAQLAGEDGFVREQLLEFRHFVRRWQGMIPLPIDQLVLALAQDLFDSPPDLALAHKLAGALAIAAAGHPEWRLKELTQELATIARNERKFLGFGDQDGGFDPDAHRGKVVVATVHKAKGLEWDRVYLVSANNYDYPAALPGDQFIAEKDFLRGGLNLPAEALAQLDAVFSEDYAFEPEGAATRSARFKYAAERLRLLYVGITRAKRDLIITWNNGRSGRQRAAVALTAVSAWWEEHRYDPVDPEDPLAC